MEHREESQLRETKTLWREGMASVRHGKPVTAWDGEVKAGDAGRSWTMQGLVGRVQGFSHAPGGHHPADRSSGGQAHFH